MKSFRKKFHYSIKLPNPIPQNEPTSTSLIFCPERERNYLHHPPPCQLQGLSVWGQETNGGLPTCESACNMHCMVWHPHNLSNLWPLTASRDHLQYWLVMMMRWYLSGPLPRSTLQCSSSLNMVMNVVLMLITSDEQYFPIFVFTICLLMVRVMIRMKLSENLPPPLWQSNICKKYLYL